MTVETCIQVPAANRLVSRCELMTCRVSQNIQSVILGYVITNRIVYAGPLRRGRITPETCDGEFVISP
jgi:hypothetical protein